MAPHPSRPPIFADDEVIGGRYRVLRFIARGGMGEVYEVEDQELKTRIALKALSAIENSSPHRMKREILLAREVAHHNVCRVFDVGHHNHAQLGDTIFLTMELLDGETLRCYLNRSGPLDPHQAKALLQQIISAVSAAHQVGVIHRDLKPGNVILVNHAATQTLKVTDFGVAAQISPDAPTETAFTVCGTPDYMPPEQFRGLYSKETDIYALGVIICEMLTAKIPESRSLALQAMQSPGNRAIETQWRTVVEKCLAPDPSERFHDVEDVWAALSPDARGTASRRRKPRTWLLAAAAALALLIIALGLLMRAGVMGNPFSRLPSQKHVAVLPFENLGNDSSQQALADGLADSLTGKLSQLERYQESFWIVPASDSRRIRSLDDAYRNFNVNLAVTGSIERTADGVLLTTNLVDARRHKQLASRSIQVSSANLDALQTQVWQSVADMLDVEVDRKLAEDMSAGGTANSSAFDLYEQGVGYLRREDVDRALDMFTKALSRDPQYALAYAGLGDADAAKYFLTKDPAWMTKATLNARHALQFDDRLTDAHLALGKIYQGTGRLDDALAEYRRVLGEDPASIEAEDGIAAIDKQLGKTSEAESAYKALIARRPGDAWPHDDLGNLYYRQGNFTQAVFEFQTAIDLAPDNPTGYQDLGGAYLAEGRYEDAVSFLEQALNTGGKKSATMAAIDPRQAGRAWGNLGAAYMYLGRYSEAVDAMKRATELEPHNDDLWRNLGDAYRQVPGNQANAAAAYAKALRAAEDQLEVNPRDPETISDLALYQAHLGQKQEAAASIARALSLAPDDSYILFTSALVYVLIGQPQKSLSALDQAVRAGYSLKEIEQEPELRPLQSNPKYRRWLQVMESNQPLAPKKA